MRQCISCLIVSFCLFFFFQAEDGIRDKLVTGVQTCALPIWEYNTAFFGLGNDPLPSLPHEPFVVYQRNLRVEVTEVLWPPSLKGITNIVFGCDIAKNWPPSWWAYTNTPGIFFLTKKPPPDNE